MSMRLILLGLFSLLAPFWVTAAEVSTLSQRVDAHYARGEYDAALEIIEKLQQESDDPSILYDKATIYAKRGELGKAISLYRQYLIFYPRDQDALFNMERVIEKRKDRVRVEQSVFDPLLIPHRSLSRSETGLVATFLWGVFVVLVVLRIYKPLPIPALIIVCLLWMMSFASWCTKSMYSGVANRGVVTSAEVSVRSGAGHTYTELFKLHDGAELVVDEQRGEWYRVSFDAEKRGWLHANQLAVYAAEGI